MTTNDNTLLFCFPFAGAGPGFYSPWNALGFNGLHIKPIPLPGRERLIGEAPFTRLHDAVEYAYQQIIRQDLTAPYALFGHCFLGSVIAWEVARRLANTTTSPCHLFISASRAPSVSRQYGVQGLADGDFVDQVKKITGYAHPAYDIAEMRELIVPTLRADFEMDESYAPAGEMTVSVPVTAFHAADDESLARSDIAKWQEHCTGGFDMLTLSGGHMYLAEDPLPLLNAISTILAAEEGRK